LSNVKSIKSFLEVKAIRYYLAVGHSPEDIKNFMFCETEDTKRLNYTVVANLTSGKFEYNVSVRG
jgi:hypothetical protein